MTKPPTTGGSYVRRAGAAALDTNPTFSVCEASCVLTRYLRFWTEGESEQPPGLGTRGFGHRGRRGKRVQTCLLFRQRGHSAGTSHAHPIDHSAACSQVRSGHPHPSLLWPHPSARSPTVHAPGPRPAPPATHGHAWAPSSVISARSRPHTKASSVIRGHSSFQNGVPGAVSGRGGHCHGVSIRPLLRDRGGGGGRGLNGPPGIGTHPGPSTPTPTPIPTTTTTTAPSG